MKLLIIATLLFCGLCIPQRAAGQPQHDSAKTAKEPTNTETDWLRSFVFPLTSTNLKADDADLKPLSAMIHHAPVVALGEVTHGAGDIYKMKGRIIRYLVEHEGYNVFAIEANMPEAYRLNQYITDGRGDAKELIKGMLFWTWDAQEMLDIVEWMKAYNSSHAKKIVFTGIDMQGIEGPLIEIKTAYNKYHTDSSATLAMLEAKLNYVKEARRNKKYSVGYKAAKNNKHKFRKLLNAQKEWANNKISNPHEREWVLQNIRLLQQYTEMVSPAVRDQYMAENLLWIKKQFPQEKIIVWAHNGHIQKLYPTRKVMGQYLADELKTDYYAMGFAFQEGDFTAMGKNGLSSYVAQKATAGSFEYYFHLTGIPLCMIDLNKIPTDKPEGKWLNVKHNFRWTGAVPMDNEFSETSLVNNFDALIYIDKITPSQLLSAPAKK